ncbi:MAG: hypothetical protein ACI3VA_03730 [Candidatus Limivicinus sp.]
MKKPYVKPQLYYENFELSQHVAACGWDMNQTDKDTCTALGDQDDFNNPAVTLFTDTPRCEVVPGNVGESYCYEPSKGAYGIFNS